MEDEQGIVTLAYEDEQDGNVELYHVLSLGVHAVGLPLDLPVDEVIEFAEAVQSGLRASIGEVLAHGQVGLIRINIQVVLS